MRRRAVKLEIRANWRGAVQREARMSHELRLPDDIETISDVLAFWAERTPGAPALRAPDGRAWSHHELHVAICQVVHRLSSLGIPHDARVALVLPPGVEASIALLGVMATAIAAPLNPESTPHELKRDLQRLAPRLLITGGPTALSQVIARHWRLPRSTLMTCWRWTTAEWV